MRFCFTVFAALLLTISAVQAQQSCTSQEYLQLELQRNPSLQAAITQAEQLRNQQLFHQETISGTPDNTANALPVIRIPVVIHVLYNKTEQNISEAQIRSQLDVLNTEFRKKHADTSRIPEAFRSFAADTYFEFVLATVNPKGYATSGIVRKATGTYSFGLDDKMKFTNSGGDDAWDAKRYLNIWVVNLSSGMIGYSSPLGGPAEKDGVVISYTAFGTTGKLMAPYTKGRTLVHEIGHWMGLRHIWGDQYCGNDGVDDTPQQSQPTRGCPSAPVYSNCNGSSTAVMYNNYMDLTNDECLNMFTYGQRDLMRASFLEGASHFSLVHSDGATAVPIPEPIPVSEVQVTVRAYPNPARSQVSIDISAIDGLAGKSVIIMNQMGQQVKQLRLTGMITTVNVSDLAAGMYFLKVDGVKQPVKVVKQ